VHTDANVGKLCDSRFGVDAVLGVYLLSGLISYVCHNDLLLLCTLIFLLLKW
jgi:hypothetical protein